MSEVALESTPDLTINLDNVGTQHHPEHGAKPVNQAENGGGVDGNQVSELDLFPEGRTTPTPESESANFLSRNPSYPSSTSAESPALPSATPSTTLSPRAIVGLGPLQGEDQLKSSLISNDRLFLLIVAKEVEAFMLKVKSGESPNIIPSIPLATNSTSVLASMTASFIVGSHVSSTFQRMLVYKLAEWYGLKAVHVPDVAMVIGVIGSFDTRSAPLRLSDLAPREDTAIPKIKIMQRSQNTNSPNSTNGSSRPGSVVPDDSISEASSSKVKTLEEREQAYAKAKQRIYGNINPNPTTDPESPEDPIPALESPAQIVPAHGNRRAVSNDHDDFETAPREREDPYANYQNPYGSYPYNPQQQVPMPQYGYNGHQHSHMQHMAQYPNQPQQQYMAGPSYMPMYHQSSLPPAQNPYAAGQWVQVPQNHQMMNGIPNPASNGQWIPHPNPGQMSHQPMPMIPQGMQYPAYGYPVPIQQQPQHHQQNYGYLVQPVPMRPPPHPHSSASSSISSRSYHSYHDASRPHSRGSTTSNMSATSSVRFGNLYPANQGGGTYRQTRRKHHGVNGINAPIGEGSDRQTRDHSPASASNDGSSHSSRRPESITLIPPSQHPLPQRPDWAANNIQYHPSPVPMPNGQSPGQSPADFPPLRQGGGTQAEPMQIERAKTRPVNGNGNAWNGVKLSVTSPISDHAVISPRMSISAPVPVPTVPGPSTPTIPKETLAAITSPVDTNTPQAPTIPSAQATVKEPKSKPIVATPAIANGDKSRNGDEDFPRRPPNSSQLYNPNVQSPVKPTMVEEMVPGKIPAEVIEAKLAAISIKEGVTIGPPANKKVASYAKIVRRD